jgi:hypothetical protein
LIGGGDAEAQPHRPLKCQLSLNVCLERSLPQSQFCFRQAIMEVQPPLHPYYPQSLDMPTWQPLAIPFEKILATFFTACGVVLFLGWWLTGVPRCLVHISLILLASEPLL